MVDFAALRARVVVAPMAGGPTTPELVAAVSNAGGFGFLAAAYLAIDRLRSQIAATRALTDAAFGVNIFVPEEITAPRAQLDSYRNALGPLAEKFQVTLPNDVPFTDDQFDAKVALMIELGVPVVSFTFGLPDTDVVAALHDAAIAVGVTVTTVADARAAEIAGADFLTVQGPEAGGHRSTFHIADEPPTTPLRELLPAIAAATATPILAAGGIANAAGVTAVLRAGAAAAQLGTAFLRAAEAGTKTAGHQALTADGGRTRITRAYSGRPARGIDNQFIRDFDALAPAAYPQVNTLTAALRAAAKDDPEVANTWAGVGFAAAISAPAVEIMRMLTADIAARLTL